MTSRPTPHVQAPLGATRRGRATVFAGALVVALAAVLAGFAPGARANGLDPLYGGGWKKTTGVIYKQGLVRDKATGAPAFAVYDPETGDFVEALSGGDIDAASESGKLSLGNGEDYRENAKLYVEFLESLPDGRRELLQVVTPEEYAELEYPEGFERGTPYARSRSLLVYRPDALVEETVQLDAGKGLIVHESRYALEELEDNAGLSARSLLLDEAGRILRRSDSTIGYRVAYVDPDDIDRDVNERSAGYRRGDTLLAPVANAWVENAMSIDSRTATDESGRYFSYFNVPPCPGFEHEYEIPMYAGIPYRSFNPRRRGSTSHYLLTGTSWYYCIGPPYGLSSAAAAFSFGALAAITTYAALPAQLPSPVNFRVDVSLISGRFSLKNTEGGETIPIGERTRHLPPPERDPDDEFEDHTKHDVDGDGEDDEVHVSEIGSYASPRRVEADADASSGGEGQEPISYGVWFAKPEGAEEDEEGRLVDGEGEPIEPDLIRVADRKPFLDEEGKLADIGLLETISKKDLFDTDLYVFRTSTGELVMEKTPFTRDLDDAEGSARAQEREEEGDPRNGIDEGESAGFFELTIPGRDAGNTFQFRYRGAGGKEAYEAWQASQSVAETLRGRTDSLRVGEPIRVVAINRATGYIGTADTSVKAVEARDITLALPELVLYPPNLKIHVERRYTVESGLTAGESRRYRVGSEGSALHGDQYLAIHTEWLDRDGSALPSELPGYTGRLAKLVGENALGSDIEHFEIEPGKHVEVVDLPNDGAGVAAAYHYVHVVGQSKDESPSFDADASATYPYRPGEYVPVRVAVYDEEASGELAKAQRAANEAAREADESVEGLKQESAQYEWVHRPEMMFSVYDLRVKGINRIVTDEDGNEERAEELRDLDRPTIAGTDGRLEITQYLESSEFDPLDFFGPTRDLVFQNGRNEQVVRPSTESQILSIKDFEATDADGLLALRLFNNHDAGNILSEWVYRVLRVVPRPNRTSVPISADDTRDQIFAAVVLGETEEERVGLDWSIEGAKSGGSRRTVAEEGLHLVTVDIDPTTGTEFSIEAQPIASDESAGPVQYEVVAGEPADIGLTLSGSAAIAGIGGIDIDVEVKDQFGNTVADGTPVAIDAPGMTVSADSETLGGRMSARLEGTTDIGEQSISVSAGSVVERREVTVHDIDLGIWVNREQAAGSSAFVRVFATSSYGTLPDFNARISAVRGIVPDESIRISGNSASFEMPVGNIPGKGWVLASVGTTVWQENFDVVVKDDARLTETLLVNDVSGPGSVDIDGVRFDYTNTTRMVIQGTPNELVTASVGDFLDPPFTPVVEYSMQDGAIEANVADSIGNVQASLSNVSGGISLNRKFRKSYEFSQGSTFAVNDFEGAEIEEIGFVFNFLASGGPTVGTGTLDEEDAVAGGRKVVSADAHGLTLTMNRGRLVARAVNDDDEAIVISDTLEKNRWYRVGAHRVGNEVVLQVNEDVYRRAIESTARAGQTRVVFGRGFTGELSDVRVYDWTSPLDISFDGLRNKDILLDENGRGEVTVTSGSSTRTRNRVPLDDAGNDGPGDDCMALPADNNFDFSVSQVLSKGEAFARTIADCKLLPRIREHFIVVRTPGNVVRRAVAFASLSTYTQAYVALKAAELSLALGPECAGGIVLGRVDGFTSGVCDFATALLLVGDIRDLAIHSWWWYTDARDDSGKYKYDKAVFVFSSLGIATTAASATGVGVVIDAAIAGCKVAAKVMKGSELPLALATHLENRIGDDLFDVEKIARATQGSLGLMQLVGVAVLLKDDFPKVYDSVKSINAGQIAGWMKYIEEAVKQVTPQFLGSNQHYDVPEWLRVAYAAPLNRAKILELIDSDAALQGLVRILDDTHRILDDAGLRSVRAGRADIQKIFNSSVATLGDHLREGDLIAIRELIASDELLSALSVVYDIAGDLSGPVFKAIEGFKCTRSSCDLGGFSRVAADNASALKMYFQTFSRLPRLLEDDIISVEVYPTRE